MAGIGVALPGSPVAAALTGALKQIDFTAVVFNGTLAFLFFAGSLGLDVSALRDCAGPVVVLPIISTLLSTAIVGIGCWIAAGVLRQPLSLP